MARIRYLKPEFFSDEDISELPFETRLCYQGLWCFADKEGRLENRPKYLKAMIFPYDKVDIEKSLSLLSRKPFIQFYEVEGKSYIQILTWHDHQKPHHTEKDSTFPPAPPFKDKEQDKDKDKDKPTQSELVVKDTLNIRSLTVKKDSTIKPITYRENVSLTESEYQSLSQKYGKDTTERMLDTLDNYKGAHGKKYKSDYRAILSWVAEKVKNQPIGQIGGSDDVDNIIQRAKTLARSES